MASADVRTAPKDAFPWRTFYRVALIQSTLVLAGLATAGLSARYFFHQQFLDQARTQMRDSLELLAADVEAGANATWCENHVQTDSLRFWLLAGDGEQICGSTKEGIVSEDFRFSGPKQILEANDDRRLALRVDRKNGYVWGELWMIRENRILRAAISLGGMTQTLRVVDTSLGFTLLLTALALGALSVWSARQLVFPLGRLLVKTRSIATHQPVPTSREDLGKEVFDEWVDLESNIDDIRRDLAAKVQSLSREQVELDTVMGAISDAILAVDLEGGPLFFNSRFELLFGREGLRERRLRLWGMFRDPDILTAFQGALREGRVGATKAIPLEQTNGPRRYFQLSVSPLRKKEGAIYGAVGVFHDVTELKSAEQMRIDFVANVSHELRTPLTVIKGYADTLVEDLRDQSVYLEQVKSIARNTDRLMNLMNDLLDLSSIESDSIIQRDWLNCEEVSERIVSQLHGAFEGKGQSIQIDCAAQTVYADLQRLEQVLVNLLANANKYTPAGGAISVAWIEEPNATVLRVFDNGPGIPVEHHSRLFERFYRMDKARSREQGGTGLGLAIVKHIMHRHEGGVWIDSAPGKGSAFYCRFPNPNNDLHRFES